MKIIEAMKLKKDLLRKAADLRKKIATFCSYHSPIEQPTYQDQKEQVSAWLQSHSDILKEIMHLATSISRTNLATTVSIELDGKSVSHTIAEWILRRRDLAKLERDAWKSLTDKALKEGNMKDSQGNLIQVKVERCYEPVLRDTNVDAFESEPGLIDARLEVVNAVTDLIEE